MNLSKVKHIALTLLFIFLSAENLSAQDLLARQAPIDRKTRAIDTLSLKRVMEREMEENPGANLYDDWNNTYAHQLKNVPDSFRIDLRHFHMPTPSRAITSNFGHRWGREHKGLDIKVYVGDTIRAAFSGKVRIVKYEARGYGKYIVIRHSNGLETVYGHLSKQLVKENQTVRAGEVIGLGGNTGRSTGSHLHFETRICGLAINPALMFDFRAQDVTGDFYTFRKSTYQAEGAEATRLRGVKNGGAYTPQDVASTAAPAARQTTTRKSTGKSTTAQYHKVKKGDTLSSIARKHGTTVAKLQKMNGLKQNSKLRIGMIVRY